MWLLIRLIFSLFLSYIIGSVPTAYLFGRFFKGIDIRKHGSKNVGATNAIRVLGKGPGIAVLIIDILKGILAVSFVSHFFGLEERVGVLVCLGIAAVAGHNWTLFLEFKGGKGVATSLGVLVGLMIEIPPLRAVVALAILVWFAIFLMTGFVSLSSICTSICLPFFMVFSRQDFPLVFLGIFLCIFIVLRHRSNIKRLLSRTEPRVPLPFKKVKK